MTLSLGYVGAGFDRPECVLCTSNGDVFASDRLGGVAFLTHEGRIRRLGDQRFIRENGLLPNGIALLPDHSFLMSSMADEGGVFRIAPDGSIEPYLREVDGAQLGATNFVYKDAQDRLWITVSTRSIPRENAFSKAAKDGYVVLVDARGPRIVADGLCFANEVRTSADGRFLYANETYAQRVSRFAIAADGSLGERQTFSSLPPGSFVDGMAFDEDGFLWVTTLLRNGVYRLGPDGAAQTMFERFDPGVLANALGRYDRGETMKRADIMPFGNDDPLASITSIAFCGADRRMAILGTLSGTRLATFISPSAGAAPVHWDLRWAEHLGRRAPNG